MNEQEAMKDIYKQVREEIRNEYEVRIIELEEECRELALQRDRLAELLQIALDEYDEDECATLGLSLAGRIRTALAELEKP